jgi:hypothetical protein
MIKPKLATTLTTNNSSNNNATIIQPRPPRFRAG